MSDATLIRESFLLLVMMPRWLIYSSTALLIGEKCSMLVGEDLGYSGSALDMKVPNYHAPREIANLSRL